MVYSHLSTESKSLLCTQYRVSKKLILLKFELASLHSCNLTNVDVKQNLEAGLKCILILAVQDLSETRQSQKQENNTDRSSHDCWA